MDAIDQYLNFLWTQFQYDWSVMSNPWILYTVIPEIAYFIFFLLKWYVLLIPITLPCSLLKGGDVKPQQLVNTGEMTPSYRKN